MDVNKANTEDKTSEQSNKLKILLVIPSKTQREVLNKAVLSAGNVETVLLDDIVKFKETFEKSPFDVLICEEEFDEKTIYDFIDDTFEQINWDFITKIVCTGDSSPAGVAKVIEYGFKFAITKPLTNQAVSGALTKFF